MALASDPAGTGSISAVLEAVAFAISITSCKPSVTICGRGDYQTRGVSG